MTAFQIARILRGFPALALWHLPTTQGDEAMTDIKAPTARPPDLKGAIALPPGAKKRFRAGES
jgi:hypothetical protein